MKEAIPKEIIRKNHIYQPEFLDNFFELKYIGVKVTLPKISKSPNNIGNILINSIARKIIKAEGIKRKVYWPKAEFSPMELITLILNSKNIRIAPNPKKISRKYLVKTFVLIFETTIENLFEFTNWLFNDT